MKRFVSRHATLLFLALVGGCGGNPVESTGETMSAVKGPTIIKIGALDDPGTTPLYGNAIRLAVNQMNEALGNAELQFAVAFGDDHGNNAALAKSETLRLLNDEHVLAMVSDSSGDTIQVNGLNYDPATQAPYKFPVICYQCSNGLINDPAATDPNPVNQAALRDADNWLRRIFYNANFEAKVIDQIIVAKPNGGDRNGDGTIRLSIFADGGHTSLAAAIGPNLALYTNLPTSVEIVPLTTVPGSMPPVNDYATGWAQAVDNQPGGEPDYVILAQLPVNVAGAVLTRPSSPIPIVSNNSFRRNYLLPQMGAAANGLEGSSVALANSSPSGQLFISAFTAANNGQGPEQTSSGAYDSVVTLMLATLVANNQVHSAAQITPALIKAALDTINAPNGTTIRPSVSHFQLAHFLAKAGAAMNYDGAYDADDWNSVGDIFPPLVHWTVESNAFVEHESYLCNPANPLCPVQ